MNFYAFLLSAVNKPKKFLVSYRHLTIVNYSNDVITLYYSNGSIFCVLQALDALTFLDVVQKNPADVRTKQTIPAMQLTVQTTGLASNVSIFNYGV